MFNPHQSNQLVPRGERSATNSHFPRNLPEVTNVTTCNRKPQRIASSVDESLLLGRRLYKIAHIRGRPESKTPEVGALLGTRCARIRAGSDARAGGARLLTFEPRAFYIGKQLTLNGRG